MAKKKNPAAQALGRLGGLKRGVPKGFAALSPEERSAIGKAAAEKRWGAKKRAKSTSRKERDKAT